MPSVALAEANSGDSVRILSEAIFGEPNLVRHVKSRQKASVVSSILVRFARNVRFAELWQDSGRTLAELYDWQDSGRTLAGFSQDSGKTLVGVVGFWQNSGRILANLTKIVLTTDGLWRDLTCLTKLGPPKMASVRILSEIPELASAVRLLTGQVAKP